MVPFVARQWLLAASVTAALAAAPAFAAKDVVVAVGSNFTTLDPYDANDTLSQAVANLSTGAVRHGPRDEAEKRAGGRLYRVGRWAGLYR